jgi:cell division protein FtsN
MDEPALRDVERWKDKIEVRLDNRQVFFLFFGSAMVACMLFVLGVIVGKRLESRGRAMAPLVEDPLAALDRFAEHPTTTPTADSTIPAPALTFPKALLGSGTPGKLERAANKATLATTVPVMPLPGAPLASAPVANKKLAALPRPVAPSTVASTSVSGTETKAAPLTAPVAPTKAAAPKVMAPKAVAAMAAPSVTPAPTAPSKTPVAVAAPAKTAAPASATARTDKPKAGFALQLSSFQDRSEADAFARRFAAQNAHVVASEIPGKGTWYRVRVGSYGTMKDATAAKATFERDHNVIAYVAGSGPAQ